MIFDNFFHYFFWGGFFSLFKIAVFENVFYNDTQNATFLFDFLLNFSVLYRRRKKCGHKKKIFWIF